MAKSAADERKQMAQVRALMGRGATDYEILDALNITLQTLSKLKQRLFSDELDIVQNETAAENWVRYNLRMGQNIADLDEVIEAAARDENTGALTARVGAIKAKADLIDRVFAKGQEMGVIPTVAASDQTEYPTEVPSLRALVDEKTQMLQDIVRKFGTANYDELPDIPDDEIYYDAPAAKRK